MRASSLLIAELATASSWRHCAAHLPIRSRSATTRADARLSTLFLIVAVAISLILAGAAMTFFSFQG